MSLTSGGSTYSVDKASFESENGGTFTVQYNPTEFKFDKQMSWSPSEEQGRVDKLEFQKANPATLQMELTFDTTLTDEDVRTSWVDNLVALMNIDTDAQSGEQTSLDKQRPPKVTFHWKDFEFLGVVETLGVSYIYFGSDGTPQRAKVTIKMKEWESGDAAASGGGASDGTRMFELQAGETVASKAQELGIDTRTLAEQNNSDNPMEDTLDAVVFDGSAK